MYLLTATVCDRPAVCARPALQSGHGGDSHFGHSLVMCGRHPGEEAQTPPPALVTLVEWGRSIGPSGPLIFPKTSRKLLSVIVEGGASGCYLGHCVKQYVSNLTDVPLSLLIERALFICFDTSACSVSSQLMAS